MNAYRFFRQEVKHEIKLAENSTIAKKIQMQFGMEMKKRGPLKTENPLNLIRTLNTFYSSVGKITTDKAMQLAKEHELL